ncbi:MAG: hypothetical protein Q4G42_03095 [Neisseria sp.]|nr:hypothetical protein [Neisseria sp.]
MINLYRILDVHYAAPEAEILIALAGYLYKQGDNADPKVVSAVKQWLLNPDARPLYNKQLLIEFPDQPTEGYRPEYLGTFFELKDQAVMLKELNRAVRDLKSVNQTLEQRITQLRSEEKIYRFPMRDREYLEVNYRLFARNFTNAGAKTLYFSALQIMARYKKPVRHLLYTEAKGFSYIRYYEYIILKFKVEGRKKYLLARATPEELIAKGITAVEPSLVGDGVLFKSRLLIDNKNPMYLEEAAIDHLTEETLHMLDYAIESIQTFNEAVLRVKQQQVERFLEDKAVKDAAERVKLVKFTQYQPQEPTV